MSVCYLRRVFLLYEIIFESGAAVCMYKSLRIQIRMLDWIELDRVNNKGIWFWSLIGLIIIIIVIERERGF